MVDLGKRERLRKGEAVELKPGVFGRLNKENRTLQLDSGKVLPISASNQRDLFPENEQNLDIARRTEEIESNIKKSPLGGEFFHQLGQSASIGGIKDIYNYATKTGDQYLRNKEAERRVSGRISEESPFTSGAATVASFIPDIYATKGMSAFEAAPLLTATSAGSRLITEPGEVAQEAAISAAGGKFLDKVTGKLTQAAQRRSAIRNLPGEQAAVQEANVLGKQATQEANALQAQQYKGAQQNTNLMNEALQAQHEVDVIAHQNRLTHAQNTNVMKNSKEIEGIFPKASRIASEELGVERFIDQQINKTGLAGTREAAQGSKILRTLFAEGEALEGKELAKRYIALEDAITRSTPEVQGILSNFKQDLAQKLPSILENSVVYDAINPIVKKFLPKEVYSLINKTKVTGKNALQSRNQLIQKITNNAKEFVKGDLKSPNFIERLRNGQIGEEIANSIAKVEDFMGDLTPSNLKFLQKHGTYKTIYEQAAKKHSDFVKALSKEINKKLAAEEITALNSAKSAVQKLNQSTQKIAQSSPSIPLPPGQAPVQNIPSRLARGEFPPITTQQAPIPGPAAPNLYAQPAPPTPQTFLPQPEPILPPSQGFAEQAGEFLESNPIMGRNKGLLNQTLGPVGKLAGLKYLLGPAALPAEAAYLGLKGLTSPNAGGEIARMTFKQGGIQAIASWAEKYPSYHDGILENPQERRSLNKEIEDDPEIPIEQKAVVQSKVNRGKPLDQAF